MSGAEHFDREQVAEMEPLGRDECLGLLAMVTWAPGTRQRWVRITPNKITGRRIRVLPAEL